MRDPGRTPARRDPDRQAERRHAFGERVRLLRKTRQLSQEQLAHAAALDRTYVGAVENGRRNLSLHAIWQLADALNVAPEAFFCDEAHVEDYLVALDRDIEGASGAR